VPPPTTPFDHDDLARIAFDLSPSGMLAVDESGVIVAANREAERLFGWPREELVGRPVENLVPERYRGAHPGHRAGFVRDPHSRPMGAGRELYGLHRNGTEFPIEIGLNPVPTPRGLFVLVSVVDITTRRKVEEDLRRSQRLETIGILAGGIAHDFNNILLGIVGHTELVLREGAPSPQGREDLGHVLTAAGRGRQLVRRILTFSRETTGARQPVRLDRVIGEVIQLMRASLPATIEIRPVIDPETPAVLADETQIHQILMNLMTNSAQAMPSGGSLEVRLHAITVEGDPAPGHAGLKPGRHARLIVTDTGRGMPPEVLEHALEPFFTTKAPGQGTGLGLSVVHGIVASHGGTMTIASESGRGTTITIDLPAEGAAPRASGAETSGDAEARRVRILFVEDEAVLAAMQRRQLEYLGFEVTVHTSSVEALEVFRARPDAFDLLITDDTMPRMTGSALAGEILGIRPDLPILMVSGGGRTEPGRERPPGVRKVLRKPHTLDELEKAIREVMGTSEPPG
jgi:hypothetical protein